MGHLWNSLADYYIRSGLFERARDIYEESIQTVTTVRDFTQVFDAYAQFEELALSKKMEEIAEMEKPSDADEVEVELRMARLIDCNIYFDLLCRFSSCMKLSVQRYHILSVSVQSSNCSLNTDRCCRFYF